jgi:hypothetical protein
MLITVLLCATSCAKEIPSCEETNIGTIIVENSRTKGVVKIYFNETDRIPINGSGDLNIPPGEKANMSLPAGLHNVKAILSITECTGGRCHTTTSGLPEKNTDLASCEDLNLIY